MRGFFDNKNNQDRLRWFLIVFVLLGFSLVYRTGLVLFLFQWFY